MSRNVLVIGGLGTVVQGLLVGLWILLMRGEDPQATAETPPVSPTIADRIPPAVAPHGGTTTTVGPAPETPIADKGTVKEYTVGGTQVRDHRTGDHKQLDIPPNVHVPGGRQIQPATTQIVSQKLQAVMKECVASMPREARGDKPRLEGQVVVNIKDKKITVAQSTMQLRNIAEDAAGPVKQCIEQRSVGLSDSAPGEADVQNYSINISFAVP